MDQTWEEFIEGKTSKENPEFLKSLKTEHGFHGIISICETRNLNYVKSYMKLTRLDPNIGLIAACVVGDFKILEYMHECGGIDYETGLECACEFGHIELSKLLIHY